MYQFLILDNRASNVIIVQLFVLELKIETAAQTGKFGCLHTMSVPKLFRTSIQVNTTSAYSSEEICEGITVH